jgi:hypothetical protein
MDAINPGHRVRSVFILVGLILGAFSSLRAADTYDFVLKAYEAKWFRTAAAGGELHFGGPTSTSRGSVRYVANVVLEDGRAYARVLETHPEWKNGGIVFGVFENVSIPSNAKFSARVGFRQAASGTDGAVFEVIILSVSGGASRLLARQEARYDGHLDEMSADMDSYAGKTINIKLQVRAGATAAQDWAVWESATISQAPPLQLLKAVPFKPPTPIKTSSQPPDLTNVRKFGPAIIKRIPLEPVGSAPPLHRIEDAGTLPIEEPLTLLNSIFKDNERANTYYYLPREINLIREAATGYYRVSAVWTQDQKIRTTLTLQANIDPADVKVMEEAVKAAKGPAAVLKCVPYDEANIIDMKGWEDWQIENIRIPTFGSLESELPISIVMTPETLAQLKPLLEKEGLTAGMHVKAGEFEREIPIKVGLKYFTGRWYSALEELGFSYAERDSLLTLHNVRNLSDFPLKINTVSLRFRLPNREEVYKNLPCRPEIVIPPGEFRDVHAQLVLRDQLLAEYRKLFPAAPQPVKKPLLGIAMGLLKRELDKDREKDKDRANSSGRSVPSDPKMDAFFKTYARSFWMDAAPDFDCQECLDKIWGSIEVVSYIERMRKINVEALANVFDPAAYETPLEVEKLHVEIRSPYLSAQAKDGLMAAVDLTKDKLKDVVVVYLPLKTGDQFFFEFKVKAVLKTGEAGESTEWEKVVDSLDLTLGTFHVKEIFKK